MADIPKPSLIEIATTRDGRDITRQIMGPLLEPQDTVLKLKGGNYEIYEAILKDDQVHSCLQQRFSGLTSREWEVQPGGDRPVDQEAADDIKQMLDNLGWQSDDDYGQASQQGQPGWDAVTEKMMFGTFYGFAVGECIWGIADNKIRLQRIKVRKQRRFRFGVDGSLRLLTPQRMAEGEVMPPRKFWSFCCGADNDDEPYGLGLAHWLYWPVYFKKGGIKSWLKFLEKFAQPTRKGTYGQGATQEEKKRLLAALAAIGEDSGIIVPEGMMVELIEAARSGTADYVVLYDRMNSAISKVILSQTMTTDNGSSRSQAEVHAGVKDDVVRSDEGLINGSFNASVVQWLTDWNYQGRAAYPKVWRRIEGEPDLKPQAERDKILFDMGYPPNPEYVQKTYGDGFVNPEQDVQQQAALSGIQIQSLLEILDKAKVDQWSSNKLRTVLLLSFPTLPQESLTQLLAEQELLLDQPEPVPAVPLPSNGQQPVTGNPLSDPLPGQVQFAESQQSTTVDRFLERLREKAQPELEKMVGQLRSALDSSTDLIEFRERLDNLYPDLDGETLTAVMAEAMFASRLAGLWESEQDADR